MYEHKRLLYENNFLVPFKCLKRRGEDPTVMIVLRTKMTVAVLTSPEWCFMCNSRHASSSPSVYNNQFIRMQGTCSAVRIRNRLWRKMYRCSTSYSHIIHIFQNLPRATQCAAKRAAKRSFSSLDVVLFHSIFWENEKCYVNGSCAQASIELYELLTKINTLGVKKNTILFYFHCQNPPPHFFS